MLVMANITAPNQRPVAPPRLSASLEDYIEAIAKIDDSGQPVRSKYIAAELRVTNASVTGALRALREKGFIEYEPYGAIVLTAKGRKTGSELLRSHETLRHFLLAALDLDDAQANEIACSMEHVIPPSVMKRFVRFFDGIRTCPVFTVMWQGNETPACRRSRNPIRCERCLSLALDRARDDRRIEED